MASADVEFRCFVGGLAWVTDDQALERAFSQYGKIIESKIINDSKTGRSRGFGFTRGGGGGGGGGYCTRDGGSYGGGGDGYGRREDNSYGGSYLRLLFSV
ncbi:hypothetical protein NE237_020189 [Protea cynaroides]|uniref:RRM domain-containing protein n=1 Tax=Protea cynaroides TaxID=273540 RepID=A0A9Q0HAL5_9MAGN|nr:hypothetical protein NE237_020189 [Protea cynaroides]